MTPKGYTCRARCHETDTDAITGQAWETMAQLRMEQDSQFDPGARNEIGNELLSSSSVLASADTNTAWMSPGMGQ